MSRSTIANLLPQASVFQSASPSASPLPLPLSPTSRPPGSHVARLPLETFRCFWTRPYKERGSFRETSCLMREPNKRKETGFFPFILTSGMQVPLPVLPVTPSHFPSIHSTSFLPREVEGFHGYSLAYQVAMD